MDQWRDEGIDNRRTEYAVEPLFPNRWSPRSMSGETIQPDELMSLFEAARWAPSAMNNQPWRFFYGMRGTSNFENLYNLLAEGNKIWAGNAAVLVVIVSRSIFEQNGKPNPTHSFDTGAAWMSLALAGSMRGYVVHGMAGFDYVRAGQLLQLDQDYSVEAMCAIGIRDVKEKLPPDLQKRETPSDRHPLQKTVFEGVMKRD